MVCGGPECEPHDHLNACLSVVWRIKCLLPWMNLSSAKSPAFYFITVIRTYGSSLKLLSGLTASP